MMPILSSACCHNNLRCYQGWGLLRQFPPSPYFPNFAALWNHTLAIEYHVYIWQVSTQLSCGDTVNYECDSKNRTCTFARSKILLAENLTNGVLVTSTPVKAKLASWFSDRLFWFNVSAFTHMMRNFGVVCFPLQIAWKLADKIYYKMWPR